VPSAQSETATANAGFWDELCGTALAKQVGITDAEPASLARFDAAYLDRYPYLSSYLPAGDQPGLSVLEIGLGYGTVGQALAARGLDYQGIDIAPGPVEMMRHRLDSLGIDDLGARVRVGSALEIPHAEASFDHVVSIGCLHHTGDLARAIEEVHRVLKPGGRALVMIYSRRSIRRIVVWASHMRRRRLDRISYEARSRGAFDSDSSGTAAPATEFTTRRQARLLFDRFASVAIRRENFDPLEIGPLRVDRERLLGWPARLAGVDFYVTAIK